MEFTEIRNSVRKRLLAQLKTRAFTANYRAKLNKDQARDAFFRAKDAAINASLEAGLAFVDSVDWSLPDPVFGITFIDGGKLHTKLSCLNSGALKSVRRQLNGCLTPQGSPATKDYDQLESRTTVWN